MAGVRVWAFEAGRWNSEVATDTDSSGYYKLQGLAPGQHTVMTGGGDVDVWYKGKYSISTAEAITVASGETVSNIDFTLPQGSIAGRIVGPGGVGLPNVDVVASGESADGQWLEADTVSRSDGTYDMGGIPAGSYRIRFDTVNLNQANATTLTPPGGIAGEFFDDKPTMWAADRVALTEGAKKTIDATLAAGGAIKGRVLGRIGGTPVPGVRVMAIDSHDSWRQPLLVTSSDEVGAYELKGLPAGSYVIGFGERPEDMPYGLENEPASVYYRGAHAFDAAAAVTIAAGQVVSGIDGEIVNQQGTLRGAVTGADDKPAYGVKVVFSREIAGTWVETPGDYVLDVRGRGVPGLRRRQDQDALHGPGQALRGRDVRERRRPRARQGSVTQKLQFVTVDSAEGADRFATCVESLEARLPDGCGRARDRDRAGTGRTRWAGPALAASVNGPILLVEKDSIPPVVAAEIARLANAWYEGSTGGRPPCGRHLGSKIRGSTSSAHRGGVGRRRDAAARHVRPPGREAGGEADRGATATRRRTRSPARFARRWAPAVGRHGARHDRAATTRTRWRRRRSRRRTSVAAVPRHRRPV